MRVSTRDVARRAFCSSRIRILGCSACSVATAGALEHETPAGCVGAHECCAQRFVSVQRRLAKHHAGGEGREPMHLAAGRIDQHADFPAHEQEDRVGGLPGFHDHLPRRVLARHEPLSQQLEFPVIETLRELVSREVDLRSVRGTAAVGQQARLAPLDRDIEVLELAELERRIECACLLEQPRQPRKTLQRDERDAALRRRVRP